jgi:hypothetical protein
MTAIVDNQPTSEYQSPAMIPPVLAALINELLFFRLNLS